MLEVAGWSILTAPFGVSCEHPAGRVGAACVFRDLIWYQLDLANPQVAERLSNT
jgi:hypothetical protein